MNCHGDPDELISFLCRDNAGEDGSSLLAADELVVELVAGPPSTLVLTGHVPMMEIGSRGIIKQLSIGVVDEWGNPIPSANFEVRVKLLQMEFGGGAWGVDL